MIEVLDFLGFHLGSFRQIRKSWVDSFVSEEGFFSFRVCYDFDSQSALVLLLATYLLNLKRRSHCSYFFIFKLECIFFFIKIKI